MLKVIQPELFDDRKIAEVTDLEDPTVQYCLCHNPQSAHCETPTRNRLLERLKCIRQEKVHLSGVEFQTVGTAEADQEEIFEHLGIKLKRL